MAEDGLRHKVVDNIEDCVKAVDDLLKESVVAVDCEGINLGTKGPLTLLQVAKLDGFVYLFNVFVEPKVFTEGGLKSFLENENIIKVFHGCSNDSAVLKRQYDVMLVNVFDVKMAQYVIEKSEGRQLPSYRKLRDLCRLYTDVTSLEGKEEAQAKRYKTDGAYWAKRELSPEMVDHACADVRILLPDVYDKLKRKLDKKSLWKDFEEKVKFDLNSRWNENVKDDKSAVIKDILDQFSKEYASDVKLADITSEDVVQALKRIPMQDVKQFPDIVRNLKTQILKKEMEELEKVSTEKADTFIPIRLHFMMLDTGKNSPDPEVRLAAGRLKDKLDGILMTDLVTKYNESTPGNYIAEDEKRLLRKLPSTGTNPADNPVLRHLYDVSIDSYMEKIESLRQELLSEGSRFRPSHADIRECKYFISADGAPPRIKRKAKLFLDELQDARLAPRPGANVVS